MGVTITSAASPVTLTDPSTQNPLLVTATGTVSGGTYGVHANSTPGWQMTNLGTISGTHYGIYSLSSYDTLSNGGLIATTGGGGNAAVAMVGGIVGNTGTINGSHYGVAVFSGQVGNSGVINSYNTGAGVSFGVKLGSGVVTNQGAGTISAVGDAVFIGTGTVVNSGTASLIEGNHGVEASGAATIDNLGTITTVGTVGPVGVMLSGGGVLDNGSNSDQTASIIAAHGRGVYVAAGQTATIVNLGTISGAVGILDLGSGSIKVAGTVTGAKNAIVFGTGVDTLTITPTAAFKGAVLGNVKGSDTLELAPGGKTGTASGSRFTNFSSIIVDKAAHWNLTTSETLIGTTPSISLLPKSKLDVLGSVLTQSGLSISGAGTLTVKGAFEVGGKGGSAKGALTVEQAASLNVAGTHIKSAIVDDGTITATSGTTTLNGTITGTGTVALAGTARLDVVGALSATSTTFVAGAGATLGLAKPLAVGSTISGFITGDQIDLIKTAASISSQTTTTLTLSNSGGVASILQFAGTNTYKFVAAGDGHGGTIITTHP